MAALPNYFTIELPLSTQRPITIQVLKSNGSAYNLTSVSGLGARFEVREHSATVSGIKATYTTTDNTVLIPDPTNGKVTVLIEDAATGLSGNFYFRLVITGSSNYEETVAHGPWIVSGP
jgi:hypothetical protein